MLPAGGCVFVCVRVCLRVGGRVLCMRANMMAVSVRLNAGDVHINQPASVRQRVGARMAAVKLYNTFHFTLGYRCRGIYIITFVLVPVLCDLCVHSPFIRTRLGLVVLTPWPYFMCCALGF